MSAHTPGPWEVRFFRSKSHRIDAPGWDELAVVYGNEDDDLDRQGRANARLIAAAPDLLVFAHDYILSQDPCVIGGPTDPETCECVSCVLGRDARAAIAKAEGKSMSALTQVPEIELTAVLEAIERAAADDPTLKTERMPLPSKYYPSAWLNVVVLDGSDEIGRIGYFADGEHTPFSVSYQGDEPEVLVERAARVVEVYRTLQAKAVVR